MTRRAASALLLCLPLVACASEELDPAFAVERSLVEVAAELRAAADADLYRFEPPPDVSGENVFRASLARLDRIEAQEASPEAAAPIRFARALAWERLGRFDRAAELFAQAAAEDSDLGRRAAELLPFTERMAQLTAPVEERGTLREMLGRLEERRARLLDLLDATGDDPRRALIEVEIERLDVRARELQWLYRVVVGAEQALEFARNVATTHGDSRRALEHVLRLGDMYAELARAVLAAADPAGAEFDAARLRSLVQAALEVYAQVAAVDGRPEREEARAAMVALDALLQRAQGTP